MHQGLLGLILAMQAPLHDGEDEPSRLAKICSSSSSSRFDQRKGAVLEAISCGVDKSKKGSFDAPIAAMLEHINKHPAYVTTSSCSGRIALFLECAVDDQGRRTKGGSWLLCEHDKVSAEDIMSALANADGTGLVYFKHEPFIMHVQCRTMQDACKLLEISKTAGYRESGISPGKKNTIVGVRTSSLKMDVPVFKNGKMLVSAEYIAELVGLANEKFDSNRKRTDEFYNLLKRELLRNVNHSADCIDGAVSNQFTKGNDHACEGQGERERTDGEKLWTVVCRGQECEKFRDILLNKGWLDRSRRNVKLDNGRVAIPITETAASSMRHVDAEELGTALKANEIELSVLEKRLSSGKGTRMSPHVSLCKALAQIVDPGDDDAMASIPRHWEEYGDLILLPSGSFGGQVWSKLEASKLWECVANGLGVRRVALKAEVDDGPMRQSHVTLMHPPHADGWVKITQNAIHYTWDVTRVMFSRGNVNERRRMGKECTAGETVVDLFAGIGYFTLPMLVHGRASRALACEWNPDSVEALRRNLVLNGVQERCEVKVGDNRVTASAPDMRDVADRVVLGLLPSSESGWALGVGCLKPCGGWMHVHGNVGDREEAAWSLRMEAELERLCVERGRPEWVCKVRHVERVKSYAPRVWHLVADVECRPPAPRISHGFII